MECLLAPHVIPSSRSLNIIPHNHAQVLFAALSTCDPGSIFDSVKEAKATKIR